MYHVITDILYPLLSKEPSACDIATWLLLLQLQERILEWFKSGSWQEIITEKRSVLTSMQQVLQSCHALLDSTQVPVNSIIKLLQHILR